MNAALNLRALPALLEGYAAGIPELAVTGVALDSRAVQPGELFLAVRGHAGHGLDHVAQALARGASAVAWEPVPGRAAPTLPVPAIAVERLGARAGDIAARWWRHPSRELFTVGITGTDGKTSTAHLIAQALDRLATPCAYFGTLGYGRLGALDSASHTTPDALRLQALLAAMRDAGTKACAMEVSSHALDQRRVAGVEFDVALLTNVGRDHLDYHGSLDDYAAAKFRLFDEYAAPTLILNRDDPHGRRWIAELGARRGSSAGIVRYGIGGVVGTGDPHVLADELRLHAGGLSLAVRSSWGSARLDSRLLGRFNASNLLAALAALLSRGIALEAAVAALAESHTVPGRVEGFRAAAGGPLVVVDYAHTPQALSLVLAALRAHTAGQLICVFGCGGDRDRGKRPLMGAAAAQGADALIITDDNPRSEAPEAIVDEILGGLADARRAAVRVIHDRANAIDTAIAQAGNDDVVLVAGKGHEATQTYGSEVRAFSDRAHVAKRLGLEPRP